MKLLNVFEATAKLSRGFFQGKASREDDVGYARLNSTQEFA